MLIVRTPFRVSLFGGGTDIPKFFREYGGQVLGFAIDKYSYVTIRDLPPFYDHNFRLSYSRIEQCKNYSDISHPLLRVALKDFKSKNLEIHYDADLPGNSGIGSSSSFAVGLANGLFSKNNQVMSKEEFANKAIDWERNHLKEKGGYQDQIFASYGGFNNIIFNKDNSYCVNKLALKDEYKQLFLNRLLLCYVPAQRFSSIYSVENHLKEKSVNKTLLSIKNNVEVAEKLICEGKILEVGKLLNENWNLKKSLPGVTNIFIDETYKKAINNGAIGGKLLGAGLGGFMIFICKEGFLSKLKNALSPLVSVQVNLDEDGSKVIYNSLK